MSPEQKLAEEFMPPADSNTFNPNRWILQSTWARLVRYSVNKAKEEGHRLQRIPDILHRARPSGDCTEALREHNLEEEGQPPILVDLSDKLSED